MPSATIEFHDDELFIGYLSRYARGLGLSGVFDLLLDLSVPRKGTLNGAAEDIQKICGILGTDFDRAMRQTFQRGAGQSVQLGDHLFQDQRLLRGQFRVCPQHQLFLVHSPEPGPPHWTCRVFVPPHVLV